MRLTTLLLFLLYSLPAAPQSASDTSATIVSGVVSLTDGTAAQSGIVSFYQIDPPPASNTPQLVRHAPVRPLGNFAARLTPGTYRVCTQVWDIPGLDPCSWSESAPTVTIEPGMKNLNFPIVLTTGKFVRLRVDDPLQQLLPLPSHKAKPDSELRFGIMTSSGFVRPATIESSDSAGIVYRAILPMDQAAPLLIHHRNITLANLPDEEWSDITSFYSPQGDNQSKAGPKLPPGTSNPDVTLSVTGVLPK